MFSIRKLFTGNHSYFFCFRKLTYDCLYVKYLFYKNKISFQLLMVYLLSINKNCKIVKLNIRMKIESVNDKPYHLKWKHLNQNKQMCFLTEQRFFLSFERRTVFISRHFHAIYQCVYILSVPYWKKRVHSKYALLLHEWMNEGYQFLLIGVFVLIFFLLQLIIKIDFLQIILIKQ